MTFPDIHLADEAVAAYVDDGLSSSARQRADRHLRWCVECQAVVEAQQEAKVLLAAAPDPDLPTGLLARLRDIPMTADLGGSDIMLVVNSDGLAWASLPDSVPPGDARLATATEPGASGPLAEPAVEPAAVAVAGGPTGARLAGPGPAGAAGSPADAAPAGGRRPVRRGGELRGARPRSYPTGLSARPLRRGRRRLAGALAGLAFGVIASAASTTAPNAAAPTGQLGTGGAPAPAVNRGGTSSATTLEINTLRVGPDRRESDLLPVSRRGR